MRLSVIIPVYNEERTIEAIIEKVAAARLPAGMEREIVVIDDCSRDSTRSKIESFKSRYGLKVLLHEKNAGKGAGVKTGLAACTGDFVVVQDADLEYDPADYAALLEPLLKGEADAVFGSRYIGKRLKEVISINYFANRVLTAVSNLFTGFRLTDMETCYKVFTKAAARAVAERLRARRFDMEPEITAILSREGFRVREVPISYDPRTAREGKKIKWHDGFPAVWSIVKSGTPCLWPRRKWPLVFGASLAALMILFSIFLGPNILGDTPSYLSAIDVLEGGEPLPGFVPNRILTTFLGLETIIFFSRIFGGALAGWFFLNSALFALSSVFFFKLLARMFESEPVAYLGAMLLASNYGFLLFSLNYSMDIGGWAFYIFSLYFLYRYSETRSFKPLILSAACIGIGGLFKEYAFLGAVAIAAYLILDLVLKRQGIKDFIKKALGTAALALVPTILLYIFVYLKFGYTYADWLGMNSEYYVYASRIKEFIKALGSLHNILALVSLGGLAVLVGKWRGLRASLKVFLVSMSVSALPIFLWPAITQRILVPTVPVAVVLACFLFKRFESRWYAFLPALALCLLATFLMDSYLLTAINLPF